MLPKIFASLLALVLAFPVVAAEVKYEFEIDTVPMNVTGKEITALAVGGTIPGPTIEANVGDTLTVTFHNRLDVESSVHWHGILLPNDQDGVPYLTTQPIPPKTSFTFSYPVIHSGTYWYHSHTGLQEQRGVYGAIIFHPEQERVEADREHVLVFSDWIDEHPDAVMRNLKRDGDYYALKKGSVQSWAGAIRRGGEAITERVSNAWIRMGGMDLSDIAYDAFLINGAETVDLGDAKPGERIRLRLINAGASSYFWAEFSGGPMTVVAADGVDVTPFEVKRLRMAIAETYDVIVSAPSEGKYEFRATSEDGTGYAIATLGSGVAKAAPTIARPNLYIMDHGMMGGMDHGSMDQDTMDHDSMESGAMDHSQMDHSQMDHAAMGHDMPMEADGDVIEVMDDYAPLIALDSTEYDADRPRREVVLELTGNMERYVWSFGNKTLSEADSIKIRQGETVTFRLVNRTMMHHPLHLHGHFFRVLNGRGERSPLKHTVNVPPMGEVVIEFAADEEKDWFFHCHNLYHMKAGMARVISYENTSIFSKDIRRKISADWHPYAYLDAGAQSNMIEARGWAISGRNMIELEAEWDYEDLFEVEAVYERNFNRFFDAYAGIEIEKEDLDDPTRTVGVVGAKYMLPLFIETDLRIDTNGHVQFTVGSTVQLTSRGKFIWDWNTDKEYRLRLDYAITERLSFIATHDSEYDAGAGLMLRF